MKRSDAGAMLLEMLAAITILGFAGLALVEFLASGSRVTAEARTRELELAEHDRLLAEFTLLAREDLDTLRGRRQVGPHFVEVRELEPALYRIAVGRMEAPAAENLVTVVWRAQ